jgi:hypothetical protein
MARARTIGGTRVGRSTWSGALAVLLMELLAACLAGTGIVMLGR